MWSFCGHHSQEAVSRCRRVPDTFFNAALFSDIRKRKWLTTVPVRGQGLNPSARGNPDEHCRELLLISPTPSLRAFIPSRTGDRRQLCGPLIRRALAIQLARTMTSEIARGDLSLSPPRRDGLFVGPMTRVVIGAVIWCAYLLLWDRFVPAIVQELVTRNGLATPLRYWTACRWIATTNAALREHAFRWFIFRKCARRMCCADGSSCFTAHHALVVKRCFDWPVTLLCSFGVFVGRVV